MLPASLALVRILACAAMMALLAVPARGQAEGGSGSGAGPGGGPAGETGGSGAESEALPDPFGGLFEAINPARVQRRFDVMRGLDPEVSTRPRAPELPLALFLETIRPLGALKYENQLNYFVSGFSGSAPTLQTLSYEYVFADWNAARIEIISPEPGAVDALGLGYQRTLGVGRNHNWAHGVLILPEFSLKGTGFVGGSSFYTVSWKPEEESPWTTSVSVGANRASMQNRPLEGAKPTGMEMRNLLVSRAEPTREQELEARVWRPLASGNLWYTFSPKLTVGVEAVSFPHGRFGEYLVQPTLIWRPAEHFFLQAGAGWYEVGGDGQAAFMCRVNLLNPSRRRGHR